jgi:hypothetical protein
LSLNAPVELLHEKVITPTESESFGQSKTEVSSVLDVLGRGHVFDKASIFNINGENLTDFVNNNHTISGWVSGSHKHKLISQSLSVQEGASGDIVHVEETLLCDHEELSILWHVVHKDWKVTWCFWSNLNLSGLLEFGSSWSWLANFHNMKVLDGLSLFLLGKAEKTILVGGVVSDWNVSEATSATFKNLVFLHINEVELHLAADVLLVWRVESN